VLFHAGTDSSDEPGIDSLTYKLRGLYFDGSQTVMTEDATKRLVLHHTMTIEAWFMPSTTSGSIFSKSYVDYTNATTSEFFDLRVANFGKMELSIKGPSSAQVS
jgi:hypothetical protein